MAEPQPAGESRPAYSPDDALPPVQPPSGKFILQLFFIPLFIVTLIVCVWLAFSWLAHVGNDPKDLVSDLRRLNDSSWQKALNLANLLRDAEFDQVKDDPQLAQEIATVLDAEITAAKLDPKRLQLRFFLCKSLGEFRVADGIPVLIRAMVEERDSREIVIRGAAVEAIAVLADKVRDYDFRGDQKLMEALEGAAISRSDNVEELSLRQELRSRAAFTLGVIGGDAALSRLERMLDDSYSNVRYNAANGLARFGDLRSKRVLLEMLDPDNQDVVKGEKSDSEQKQKRLRVQNSALDAIEQLAKKTAVDQQTDWQEIVSAVQRLAEGGASGGLQSKAKETIQHLASPVKESGRND